MKIGDHVEVTDEPTRQAKLAAGEIIRGTVTAIRECAGFTYVEYRSGTGQFCGCNANALSVVDMTNKRWRK